MNNKTYLKKWAHIVPRSIQNQSKTVQESIKNQSKERPGRYLGGLRLHGASCDPSRAIFRTVQKGFLNDFAANIRPSWDPRWHQVSPNIVQKWISKSMKNLKPLEIRFLDDFGGCWEATWSQVGTKMASKIDLILKRPSINEF